METPEILAIVQGLIDILLKIAPLAFVKQVLTDTEAKQVEQLADVAEQVKLDIE